MKQKVSTAALFPLLAFAVGNHLWLLASSPPMQVGTEARLIADMWTRYSVAMQSGTAQEVTEFFSPDAVLMEPGDPPAVGKDAILSVFEAAFKHFTVDRMNINSAETQIAGEWAFDRGTYVETVTAKSGANSRIQVAVSYLAILRREPGQPPSNSASWRIARLMVNTTTPAAPRVQRR